MKGLLDKYKNGGRQHLRAMRVTDPDPESTGPIEFIASTEGIKRDGLELKLEQWELSNFKRNPVMLWAHDYMGQRPPIGRVEIKQDKEQRALIASVTFDSDDPFAADIERKYRNGFLNAVSVGWNTVLRSGKNWTDEDLTMDDLRFDLLDLSAVPVPGDPDALMERQLQMARSFVTEYEREHQPVPGVRPAHRSTVAPIDTPWIPTKELLLSDLEARTRSCAFVNDDAYYFPHHLSSGEVVWRGVATAMVRLFTSPPIDLNESERKGVYTHLARHYEQFRKEPPEYLESKVLSALTADDLRGLFLEGEQELLPAEFERAGAVLNKRNRDDLNQAISLLQAIAERSAKAEASESDDPDPSRIFIDEEDEIPDDGFERFSKPPTA